MERILCISVWEAGTGRREGMMAFLIGYPGALNSPLSNHSLTHSPGIHWSHYSSLLFIHLRNSKRSMAYPASIHTKSSGAQWTNQSSNEASLSAPLPSKGKIRATRISSPQAARRTWLEGKRVKRRENHKNNYSMMSHYTWLYSFHTSWGWVALLQRLQHWQAQCTLSCFWGCLRSLLTKTFCITSLY